MSNVVYYIGVKGDDHVKIGTTKNLNARLKALSTARADGDRLVVLATEAGTYELEQRRHRQFAESRAHGEWFKLTPTLQQHIDDLAARTSPAYALGYDEGYMAALGDRGVVELIRCAECGEVGPPAHLWTEEDEERPDTCGICYGDIQDAIATVETTGWFLLASGLGWNRDAFKVLPLQVQRRLLILAERDIYPDNSFKTMMLEVIG